MCNKFNI